MKLNFKREGYFLVLLFIFNACKINTPEQYKKSKLYEIIEDQTKEIIDKETKEEFEYLSSENVLLEKKIRRLQYQLDSLLLNIPKPDSIVIDDFCFVFFNAGSVNLKSSSSIILDSWIANKHIKKANISKILITGYSDISGNSIVNIKLARDRALHLKNILTREYCMPDNLISIVCEPNMNGCRKELYRSVKIQAWQ